MVLITFNYTEENIHTQFIIHNKLYNKNMLNNICVMHRAHCL